MHAILASFGTDGDVFPFVALGRVLRERGHRVTLATSSGYESLANDEDLGFCPLMSQAAVDGLLSRPEFWHPIRGPLLASRWGRDEIAQQYRRLAEIAQDDQCVLATTPAVLAARIVQESLSRPLASIVLQPWMVKSLSAPPIMPGGLTLPSWAPRPIGRMYWRLVNALGDALVGGPLNRVRLSLGLKPIRQVFEWWMSPARIIGLFPDWYGCPQDDWPRHIQPVGFPMSDGRTHSELDAEIVQFCREGNAPIAVTFGTGMMHAAAEFDAVATACERLGLRAVFATKYRGQLPAVLPPTIRHAAFTPFRQLFSHCAAVVHHGGIGTTARALAAGKPQLVFPMGYDQFDNADRLRRLGVGRWIPTKRRSVRHIADALTALLTDSVATRCQAIAARFPPNDPLTTAAELLEELAGTHVPQSTLAQ